jgi:hypothetical protein
MGNLLKHCTRFLGRLRKQIQKRRFRRQIRKNMPRYYEMFRHGTEITRYDAACKLAYSVGIARRKKFEIPPAIEHLVEANRLSLEIKLRYYTLKGLYHAAAMRRASPLEGVAILLLAADIFEIAEQMTNLPGPKAQNPEGPAPAAASKKPRNVVWAGRLAEVVACAREQGRAIPDRVVKLVAKNAEHSNQAIQAETSRHLGGGGAEAMEGAVASGPSPHGLVMQPLPQESIQRLEESIE